MNKVYFSSFLKGGETDHTPAFAEAMAYLREHPGTTFVIEPGVYTITSELARKTQQDVMEGKYGENPQRIMFNPRFVYSRGISFAGQKGTTVEAYGVKLMVDGFMEPVSVRDCEGVTVRGLTIDHKRKPYSKGVLTEHLKTYEDGSREFLIELDEDCPVTPGTPVYLRSLLFNTDSYENIYPETNLIEFVDEHHLKAVYSGPASIKVGLEYYTVHSFHSRPAILIENAVDTVIEDVTIHSQPGMGIVGNRSENITISRLKVTPSLGHHLSTNTDATHFTSITGLLRFEDCLFEAQGDDFINVHTYYHAIIERKAPDVCVMQEKTPDGTHAQTLDYPDVGDTLELTNRKTMQLVDSFKVLDCTSLHDEWKCVVTLDHPLPEDTEDLVLADVTRLPRLEVVGCNARSHFARSILIKTRDVLIENNNFFDVRGSAIHLAPEASWYEGVAPANVVIRRNRIIRCCHSWPGKGAITIIADSQNPEGQCMHNIVIEDNFIDCPTTDHGILVRNVEGLKIYRNQIISRDLPMKVFHCTNVEADVEL